VFTNDSRYENHPALGPSYSNSDGTRSQGQSRGIWGDPCCYLLAPVPCKTPW